MDTVTFQQLLEDISAVVFPDSVPENLTGPIRQFAVDAMIDLQSSIDCLQENHIDVVPHSATFFRCGLSMIESPRGVIRQVTVVEADYCNPVTYHPRNFDALYCWSRRFNELVTAPANTGMPEIPLGFKYPEKSTDSEFGRALRGLWAINKTKLYIAPWIQSTESVLVEWDGFKRKWADSDLVPDEDDLKRAVRLFVQREYARDFEKDYVDSKAYDLEYRDIRSDLMIRCRDERKTQPDKVCESEMDAISFTAATTTVPEPEPESITLFAVIGDYGVNNQPADDVSALVKSWNPEFVVTTGDNNYPSGEASTIDENVGRNWRPYIFPYAGAQPLKPGEVDATENRFFPSLGNHDLDNTGGGQPGQPYYNYFPIDSQNKRYYEFVWGHCHFFILNSGLLTDTDGVPVEPDGNDQFSIQAEWLQMRVAKSVVRWKIGVLHQPPYASNAPHYGGQVASRWNFKAFGLDILLSGHGHGFERLLVDGFPYIVNGAGGGDLYAFSLPVIGSQVRYNADYGAQKVTATCDELRLEFWNRAGGLIDTLVLT